MIPFITAESLQIEWVFLSIFDKIIQQIESYTFSNQFQQDSSKNPIFNFLVFLNGWISLYFLYSVFFDSVLSVENQNLSANTVIYS